MIARYEQEAREGKIRPYRIELEREPSVRSELAKLRDGEPYLQRGGAAVFTVTGAEVLLRLKLRSEDEQSDLEQFFGYLQWTREGLREFPYPIVLWVSHRILREMSRRAPDFWGWRKAVLRFVDEEETLPQVDWQPAETVSESQVSQTNNNFLPPLEELLGEIQELEQKSPNTVGLAALYDKLGQVYANRIEHGQAKNLEQERELAIQAFKKSIEIYTIQFERKNLPWVWLRLGDFLKSQSYYTDAIEAYQTGFHLFQECGDQHGQAASLNNIGNIYRLLKQYESALHFHKQSLEISQTIGARWREAISLGNLGLVYDEMGQHEKAISFYQQSLEIKREVGDRYGEAISLGNLGLVYHEIGQYERAISFYQQSLEIKREIGDRYGEAVSWNNIGNIYNNLEQYEKAIDCHQKALEIRCRIGDRHGQAQSWQNLGNVLLKYEPRRWEALQAYEQAKAIFTELKLDHEVEKCNTAIYNFDRKIPTQQKSKTLELPKQSARARKRSKFTWKHYFFWAVAAVVIVILVIMVFR
ncbi:tetratricopeptide repeat protein [Alkalinema pantanalense CENA528]|uniref:tetratricopeptide repeat protein n=1 Tax=Alkalinema pantanalense TaxID=1620705 RepID=UPI003D6E1434